MPYVQIDPCHFFNPEKGAGARQHALQGLSRGLFCIPIALLQTGKCRAAASLHSTCRAWKAWCQGTCECAGSCTKIVPQVWVYIVR